MEKKIDLQSWLEFIRNFKRVGKLKKLNKTPLLSEINLKAVFLKYVCVMRQALKDFFSYFGLWLIPTKDPKKKGKVWELEKYTKINS